MRKATALLLLLPFLLLVIVETSQDETLEETATTATETAENENVTTESTGTGNHKIIHKFIYNFVSLFHSFQIIQKKLWFSDECLGVHWLHKAGHRERHKQHKCGKSMWKWAECNGKRQLEMVAHWSRVHRHHQCHVLLLFGVHLRGLLLGLKGCLQNCRKIIHLNMLIKMKLWYCIIVIIFLHTFVTTFFVRLMKSE